MKALKIWFFLVLITMLVVVSWASLNESILEIPKIVQQDVWFIATLFDTYFAFIAIYLWMAYRTPSWVGRIVWFLMVMLLGNIGIALYLLLTLLKLPPNATMRDLLLTPADLANHD